MANKPDRSYRAFTISKRDGSEREIMAPMPDLKALQRWIASEVASKMPVSKFAHAFRSGRSIKTNARFHLNKKYVVRIDVEDFFGSTRMGQVENLMISKGYTKSLSRLIASISTYHGSLPQGAPSSPAWSNSIYYEMDLNLGNFALKNGWHYTRYADDLTFSGDGDLSELFSSVHRELAANGLKSNIKKTRVMRRGSRQVVCGTVLNQFIGPPREFKRRFLQEYYYIKKFGLAGHIARNEIETPDYLQTLLGRGQFLAWMLEHQPKRSAKILEALDDLRSLELTGVMAR